ncbi:MAG: DUF4271 domain-containing protein [Bacteroidaceae bacterium]|nr:DUF4271 domain-containing protein [Bacteroidaceae bacterium]
MNATDSISNPPADTLALDSIMWHQYVMTDEAEPVLTLADTFRFEEDKGFCISDSLLSKGMNLPDKGMVSNMRKQTLANDINIAGLFLFTFIVIAVIFSKGRYLIAYRIKDFFHSKRKYSDEYVNPNTSAWRNNLALCSVLSLSLSLIVYQFTRDNYPNAMWNPYIPFILLGATFGFAIAWIYIKGLLYSFINWIFFDRESNKKWMSSYFLINSLTAFIVFPISLLAVFGNITPKTTLYSLLFVLIIVKILLFFKILNNFKARNSEYLFIFLYFCAVEIVPALAMWQVFSNTDRNLTVIFF